MLEEITYVCEAENISPSCNLLFVYIVYNIICFSVYILAKLSLYVRLNNVNTGTNPPCLWNNK